MRTSPACGRGSHHAFDDFSREFLEGIAAGLAIARLKGSARCMPPTSPSASSMFGPRDDFEQNQAHAVRCESLSTLPGALFTVGIAAVLNAPQPAPARRSSPRSETSHWLPALRGRAVADEDESAPHPIGLARRLLYRSHLVWMDDEWIRFRNRVPDEELRLDRSGGPLPIAMWCFSPGLETQGWPRSQKVLPHQS
jgi:hypothetical protein